MLGDREIAKSSVEVNEGDSVTIEFALPYLMDDEKAKVENLMAGIASGWDDASATANVDAKLGELRSLVRDVSYSPKLSKSRMTRSSWRETG